MQNTLSTFDSINSRSILPIWSARELIEIKSGGSVRPSLIEDLKRTLDCLSSEQAVLFNHSVSDDLSPSMIQISASGLDKTFDTSKPNAWKAAAWQFIGAVS